MLSINFITQFLNDNQENIDDYHYKNIKPFELDTDGFSRYNAKPKSLKETKSKSSYVEQPKLDKSNFTLPSSFDILFNKNLNNFYYDNKSYRNKSPIFSLINSVLMIGNETFNLNNESNKENIIKQFIKRIDSDLFEKDLYNKFGYNKIRTLNKGEIQEVLKRAYYFKYDDENIHILKGYIADYLGVNLYIINKKSNLISIEDSEYYLPTYFTNNYNEHLPNMIILNDNEIYKPLLKRNQMLNNASFLTYNNEMNEKEIIDNIWKYMSIEKMQIEEESANVTDVTGETKTTTSSSSNGKFTLNSLKKLKVDELRTICLENKIDIQKKSEKTNKMINKLKDELITDLIKLN